MANSHILDDVAVAALWALRGAPVEHLGLLYSDGNGGIHATPAQTQAAIDKARGRFTIPAGSLRGTFHNHPLSGNAKRDKLRREFSPEDIAQAQRLGVPAYLLVGDEVRVFNPETSRPLPGAHSPGEPVLAQFPIEVFLERIAQRNPIVAAILAERTVNPMARTGRAPTDPRGPYLKPPVGLLAARGGLLSD